MQNESLKKELESLASSYVTLKDKISKSNGDAVEYKISNDEIYSLVDNLHNRIDRTLGYLYQLEEALYSHASHGHLPKLTPSQLQSALENCGADKDYQVKPKTIYATTEKGKILYV